MRILLSAVVSWLICKKKIVGLGLLRTVPFDVALSGLTPIFFMATAVPTPGDFDLPLLSSSRVARHDEWIFNSLSAFRGSSRLVIRFPPEVSVEE